MECAGASRARVLQHVMVAGRVLELLEPTRVSVHSPELDAPFFLRFCYFPPEISDVFGAFAKRSRQCLL
jgi:hypothetical protein